MFEEDRFEIEDQVRTQSRWHLNTDLKEAREGTAQILEKEPSAHKEWRMWGPDVGRKEGRAGRSGSCRAFREYRWDDGCQARACCNWIQNLVVLTQNSISCQSCWKFSDFYQMCMQSSQIYFIKSNMGCCGVLLWIPENVDVNEFQFWYRTSWADGKPSVSVLTLCLPFPPHVLNYSNTTF